MTDITELAQRMKAAAEKATPGEWVYFPKNTSIEYDVGSDESQGSILYVDSGDFTQAQTDRNGEFIALANPANILALVEALEKAQATEAHCNRGWIEAHEQEARAEAAEQRIAELESRAVKLPEPFELAISSSGLRYYYADEVDAAIITAGIKVEAE
ncbi:RelE family toxin-antitoxin system [Klebsiella quasipneumoniae]|uniref:ead/Ea22-like family protein n=1 Tax=Klebsiella quasipneumoniae TaxID=1463165 RepID=UPI00125BFF09|nr:ead/Ea22-like family protein [Klebsiella quasipneumoniae]VAS57136.1 RelE family toxin-antitoxin system [Klebsiella quasipneumoniae]